MTGQNLLIIGLILGFVAGFLTCATGGVWLAIRDTRPGQPRLDEPEVLPVRTPGATRPRGDHDDYERDPMGQLSAAVAALGDCEHGVSRMLPCGACDVVSDMDDGECVVCHRRGGCFGWCPRSGSLHSPLYRLPPYPRQ